MDNVRVLMSDTLGGNIINICKLWRVHQIYGDTFTFFRASHVRDAWCDKPLGELMTVFPFVTYGGPLFDIWDEYIKFVDVKSNFTLRDRNVFREKYGFKVVGCRRDLIQEVYPKYDGINCSPPIDLEPADIGSNAVVIQVWGGKFLSGHARVFSIQMLAYMCKYFTDSGYNVYLIGQPNKLFFPDDLFDKLADTFGITNLVGKTSNILDALKYVYAAKFVMGFDGVFVFFSSAAGIRTMNFCILSPNPRLQKSNDTCEQWLSHTILFEGIRGGEPLFIPQEAFIQIFNELKAGKGGWVRIKYEQ